MDFCFDSEYGGDVLMPKYDYECIKCKKEFDDVSKIDNRNDSRQCPHCKTDGAHVLIIKHAPYFRERGIEGTEHGKSMEKDFYDNICDEVP